MSMIHDSLPSGLEFTLDLNLNHPTLLPGVQVQTEATLYQGGKLFRPRLCFMMAEAVGVPLNRVAPFARIAEMVHGATLAHDDVIDEATERRKKITLNANLTQARAVLAGDLMLSRAMVELCELGNHSILKRMSEVLEDLVTGEWLQLENRGLLEISARSLDTIAGYKTASMVEWCAEIPLYVSGAPTESVLLARKFGRALGLAFQFIDDCVDFSRRSGKAFSQDLWEGLMNQVTLILISRNPKVSQYFRAVMSHSVIPDPDSFVSEVGANHLTFALNEVRQKAREHVRQASEALSLLEQVSGSRHSFQHLHHLLDQILLREN